MEDEILALELEILAHESNIDKLKDEMFKIQKQLGISRDLVSDKKAQLRKLQRELSK